jgi:hypothetical protein
MTDPSNSGNIPIYQPIVITTPNTTISGSGQTILNLPTIVSAGNGFTITSGSSSPGVGQWYTYDPATQTWTLTSGPGSVESTTPVEDIKTDSKEGCTCTKCKEFYEFATPNQPDKTLICWACRNGY